MRELPEMILLDRAWMGEATARRIAGRSACAFCRSTNLGLYPPPDRGRIIRVLSYDTRGPAPGVVCSHSSSPPHCVGLVGQGCASKILAL